MFIGVVMLTKVCTKCGIDKAVDCFAKAKKGKYGVKSVCKECISKIYLQNRDHVLEQQRIYRKQNHEIVSLSNKLYRDANKESIKAWHKQHRQLNKELITFKKKEYRKSNKEKIAMQRKRLYDTNKEIMVARSVKWQKDNAARVNAKNAFRKARKLIATPSWASQQAINGMYELAAIFNRTGINLHVDHMVPLQSELVCGLHCEANLQLLLASDNTSKGNRWWPDMW